MEEKLRFIAHRGNISGKEVESENKIYYVLKALDQSYDVEVDVRSKEGEIYIGHDYCQEKFPFEKFQIHAHKMWIHCKDLESLRHFKSEVVGWNYFFHDNDLATLTSSGVIWLHENAGVVPGGVLVHLKDNPIKTGNLFGICADNFKNIER